MKIHISNWSLLLETIRRMENVYRFIGLFVTYAILGSFNDLIVLILPAILLDNGRGIPNYPLILYYLCGVVGLRIGTEYLSRFFQTQIFRYRYLQIPKLGEIVLNKDTEFIDSENGKQEIEKAYQAVFQGGNAGIEFYIMQYANLTRNVLNTVVSVGMVIWFTKSLLIFFCIFLTILSIFVKNLQKDQLKTIKDSAIPFKTTERYLLKMTNHLKFNQEIRLFEMNQWIRDKFKTVYQGILSTMLNEYQVRFLYTVGSLLLLALNIYVSVTYLIFPIYHQLSSLGFYLSLILLFQIQFYMTEIASNYQNIIANEQFIKDWLAFIDDREPIGKQGVDVSNEEIKSIECIDVWYKHGFSDEYILKGINLSLELPQSIAIVGLNGAGKTTLIKLLCGLIQPTKGHILINGIDLQTIDIPSWHRKLGVLFQDEALFDFSIAENLTLSSTIDESRVVQSLERVGLKEKVTQLSQGIGSQFGRQLDKDGTEFSGGERQKLQLARILYRECEIGILDEPTSALDAIMEREVYEMFSKHSFSKTNIFITHRLGSTAFCDRIIVLADGRIEGMGTKDYLLKHSITYQKMHASQMHYVTSDSVR
ncbi:TPA: ABC transporter ATP-binding protein [Streptococcus suis]|nr:ABC transporter ATP-binding protein [Streptococcus suis]